MPRRVVTGFSEGKPAVVSDSEPPRTRRHAHTRGFVSSLVWATSAPANLEEDPTLNWKSFVPEPGETVALAITFPPSKVYADPAFDGAAATSEQMEALPGLAELFEPDGSGMHATPTVDYCVVLQGEIVLDLDGGETAELSAGDIVVQNMTRHAWRNVGSEPATVFFVLNGVEKVSAAATSESNVLLRDDIS